HGDFRIRPLYPLLAPSDGSSGLVTVACRRLDSIVSEHGLAIDDIGLIWIDAQGHEAQVLSGATAAMEAGVPTVLEYTPSALDATQALSTLEEVVRGSYSTVV